MRSDKTTEPILTIDGYVEPLGSWLGYDGPDFLKSDPKLANIAQNGPDSKLFAIINQFLDRFW